LPPEDAEVCHSTNGVESGDRECRSYSQP